MSRAHRDDQDLVDLPAQDATSLAPSPAQPALSNSEAARRAAERRNAEGMPEQTTEHQFTGDLPEPTRGDEDDGTPGDPGIDAEADEPAAALVSSAALRGPPPPIAAQYDDDTTWAAPPRMDSLGAALASSDTRWTPPARSDTAMLAAEDKPRWTR